MLAVWALWRFRRLRPLALAALVGLVVLGWPLRQTVRGWPPEQTVAVACDVGQGDALVLPAGPGAGVLVDTGPEVGAVDPVPRTARHRCPAAGPALAPRRRSRGRSGGCPGDRDVGVVATATLSPADDRAGTLDRLVRRAGARRTVLVPGDRRGVGGVDVEVLAPDPARATVSAAPNDLSMVARAAVRGVRVLLTGDLGADAESRLVAGRVDLRADVLKVPHHGSSDADPAFLAASGARVALVSVGADNTYGHPTAQTLAWLTRDGMRVHRTDREGDLAVAGSAGSWGVAVRGGPSIGAAGPSSPPGP